MENMKYIVAFGLLLDFIGAGMLARLTIPKRLRKLLKKTQTPNNEEEKNEQIEQLKRRWELSIRLILVGFALQLFGTLSE